jgi:hypothetical protein
MEILWEPLKLSVTTTGRTQSQTTTTDRHNQVICIIRSSSTTTVLTYTYVFFFKLKYKINLIYIRAFRTISLELDPLICPFATGIFMNDSKWTEKLHASNFWLRWYMLMCSIITLKKRYFCILQNSERKIHKGCFSSELYGNLIHLQLETGLGFGSKGPDITVSVPGTRDWS